jgi:hypothetical protein
VTFNFLLIFMLIKPITEPNASAEVKACYDRIKTAFHLHIVPLFFAYMGAFPEYLVYITDQLVDNVKDPAFEKLSTETGQQMFGLIKQSLRYSEKTTDWINRYQHSPSFYYFQQNLTSVYATNVKIAFIFIALREAVKGWAVAAKQLPSARQVAEQKKEETIQTPNQFIFDNFLVDVEEGIVQTGEKPNEEHTADNSLAVRTNELARRDTTGLEKNLLPEYLRLTQADFTENMKVNTFWVLRVHLEEIVLSKIGLYPHLIFSPINVVLQLTSKYPNFPDLLYLLSEHFPTYAMQRMMFSGFLSTD